MKKKRTYHTITDQFELQDLMNEIRKSGLCAFDTETTGLDAHQVDLVGLVFATSDTDASYIPLTHVGYENQLPLPTVINIVRDVLQNPMIAKVMQNAKYDMHIMSRYGVKLAGVHDTMLMSFATNAGLHNHGMDELSLIYLRHRTISFSDVTGKGANKVTFDYVPLDVATPYAAEDGAITLELFVNFVNRFKKNPAARHVYEDIELPLLPILEQMEQTGVKVDTSVLGKLDETFGDGAKRTLGRCWELAGHEFNPGSPKQLADLIQETFGVKLTERTATGAPSTGVKVLNSLIDDDATPIKLRQCLESVLEYRAFRKLQGTYCKGIINSVHPKTQRVHPSILQHGAQTGRMACREPNLQNVPIRTPEGRMIREAFIAEPGHKLLAADYSQIELRLLAHMADEQAMKQAFAEGVDIHLQTAHMMLGKSKEEIDSIERRSAKAINFGIPYGSSAAGIAYSNDLDIELAQKLYDSYLRSYPGVAKYMERVKQFARDHGYVETLEGRRLWLPKINSPHKGPRRFAERQAINAPIQGTAADIIKYAMIDVADLLRPRDIKTRMVLQVHDELLFEVPDEEVDYIKPLIVETMQNAYEISVPLLVDAKADSNWLKAH